MGNVGKVMMIDCFCGCLGVCLCYIMIFFDDMLWIVMSVFLFCIVC